MNLLLTYCWREWRAQRGVLAAYTALAIGALCLVFLLVPETWWLKHGQRALALSWFVAAGAFGVLGFVAPALVRGEFAAKDDQLVRRMPGALLPSFGGKLLFLLLAAAAMPLVFLLVGEWFLLAIDQPWGDLFLWEYNGDVTLQWPWPAVVLAYAALLVPWVWACGTWLPGGRMALGGAVLFALLLGVGVFAVLRQSPGIEKGIAWRDWLWAVPVAGLLAAFASWTKGRRGGGPWRSARFGLAAAAVGFVPPAAWFAERAHDFHQPDPQRLAIFETVGLTPDLRYALAQGAGHERYVGRVPFRIDLANGSATQLGGIWTTFSPEVHRPSPLGLHARTRWWGCYAHDHWSERLTSYRVLDLASGEWAASSTAATPRAMRLEAAALLPPDTDGPSRRLLQAPGGVAVWFDGGELCFAARDGTVERVRWDGELPTTVRAAGHGFRGHGAREVVFDLTSRQEVAAQRTARLAHGTAVWFVRGTLLHARRDRPNQWFRLAAGSDRADDVPIAALANADVLGLLDDDRLLCRRTRANTTELFTWHAAADAVASIALPPGLPPRPLVGAIAPLYELGSLLPRDPQGLVWLAQQQYTPTLLRLDPQTLRVERLPYAPDDRGSFRLLAWCDDGRSFLAQHLATIRRVDVATGASTQLFPRTEVAAR